MSMTFTSFFLPCLFFLPSLPAIHSSSNYPRFSANTNTGQPLDGSNNTIVARNTIFVGGINPSKIVLPVVSLDDMPPVDITQFA
jgi:hypothetical protein